MSLPDNSDLDHVLGGNYYSKEEAFKKHASPDVDTLQIEVCVKSVRTMPDERGHEKSQSKKYAFRHQVWDVLYHISRLNIRKQKFICRHSIAGVHSTAPPVSIANSVRHGLVWNVKTDSASCCCSSTGQTLLINARPRSLSTFKRVERLLEPCG